MRSLRKPLEICCRPYASSLTMSTVPGVGGALSLALEGEHERRHLVDLFLGQLAAELRHLVPVGEQQRVAGVGDDARDPLRRSAALQVRAVVLALAVEIVAGVAILG